MKKNVMMRVASIMLVLVLLTSSVISGTFAKYVTADDGDDEARVAKWGVVAMVEGELFNDSYKDGFTTYTINESGDTITVQADTLDHNVVAPGTNSQDGMTFTLTGIPEVDTNVQIAIEVDSDVCLKAGTYDDWTSGDDADKFTIGDDYYPVVFTLTNSTGGVLATGNLATIEAYLEGLSKVYDTNTNLATIDDGDDTNAAIDGIYKLSWIWNFDGARTLNGASFTADQVDQADTYLGNVAANLITDANAETNISFEISISATQIN